MSLRNRLVLPLIFSSLAVLAGCGSNGTTKIIPPPGGSFSKSNLNGTYVFSVAGTDSGAAPYAIVGAFTADGNGSIKGGTLDINDAVGLQVSNAPISAGTYTVSVDGRGTTTLVNSTGFGNVTLDFVLQDSSHGLVTEFDGNASGSGTLDVQTSGTSPAGTYAFSFSGADATSGNAFATVGNFAVGGGVGAGNSVSGLEDFNNGGIIAYSGETLSGTLAVGPSSTPGTTLTTSAFNGLVFDVYAIDATHLKFIEMDTVATLSGEAFSQSSSAIPAETAAFTLQGVSGGSPFAAGGFMVTDNNLNVTSASTEDWAENSNFSSQPTSFTGAFTAGGTGRYTLGNLATFAGGTTYAAYPSSGGLLLLEIDNSGITSGAAYPQSSTSFGAPDGYAFNLTGIFLGNPNFGLQPAEVDDIAEFASNSSGLTAIGALDENFAPAGGPSFQMALNGTYTAPDSNGRGTLMANVGNNSVSTLNGGFALNFYTVDGTTFPFIELDGGQVTSGVFIQQDATAASSAVARPHLFVAPPMVGAHGALRKQK
jgi:hypothetical protein